MSTFVSSLIPRLVQYENLLSVDKFQQTLCIFTLHCQPQEIQMSAGDKYCVTLR